MMKNTVSLNDRDKLLFTPGPLTTSASVKQSMLRDWGTRDSAFFELTSDIRRRLVSLISPTSVQAEYTAVLMQGSGTFSVESVIGSMTPKQPGKKILILANGTYGRRMIEMAKYLHLEHVALCYPENRSPDLNELETTLRQDPEIACVAVVHCETTSGIYNPIDEIGKIVKAHGKTYFVDAMSSFGAVPISFEHIDFLVSSSNKCIEGVPGIGFIIAKKSSLEKCEGQARSLSLDLFSQWKDLETKNEFRYTPPTHVLAAFHQALIELENEGGVLARSKRYQENNRILIEGMQKLGFKTYLKMNPDERPYIITSFHYLDHPKFDYKKFYEKLREKEMIVYSGKVTDAECFRIGNIGRLFANDFHNLLSAIASTLKEMGI